MLKVVLFINQQLRWPALNLYAAERRRESWSVVKTLRYFRVWLKGVSKIRGVSDSDSWPLIYKTVWLP